MDINNKRLFSGSCLMIFLVVVLTISNLGSVFAQNSGGQGNGFRISPVRYEFSVEKGKSQSVKLRVENPTKYKITADVVINDFGPPNNESGEPKIYYDANTSAPGNSFKSIASAPKTIILEADGGADLPVTINVPSNASAGGYYGAVRVVPKNAVDKNITLAASVGTLFLVQVPGELKEELNLVELTGAKNGSNGRFFINSGNMSVVTRLQNTGNIHVKPFGKITISDRNGNVVQEIQFNNTDPKANVLPKSTRKFVNDLQKRNWIGKYNISANLGYGTSGSLITAKTYFWVVPLWLIVTFIAILVAIIIGSYIGYKRYIAKKTKHRVSVRR